MSTPMVPTEYGGSQFQQWSLRDILMILFRRRWIIFGVAVPIIAFGIYGTWTTSDSFTAESQVLIEARSVEDPSFRQMVVEYDILMSTASLVAQSIPVADKAADMILPEIQALVADDEKTTRIKTKSGLRDKILEKISCGQVGESNILSISFSHENPDVAFLIVEGMTNAFMEYWVEKRRNSSALDYYSEQIDLVQAEIDDLMAQRAAIFNTEGIKAIPQNNYAGIQQMRQLEYSYYQARSEREQMESQVREVRKRVDEDVNDMPIMFKMGVNDGLRSAFNAWKESRLALAKLKMTYRDSSVHVKRQLEYVEETRRIFIETRDNFIQDLNVGLSLAQARENSLFESLSHYKEDLAAYPVLEKKITSLDLQINTQRDLLEALNLKRGEVRLKADSDQRISNITPLNEPSVYSGVSGGKKLIYLLMTTSLAIILGLVLALLVDAQDHRIFDRRQAETKLEIPVLGAVSAARLPAGKQ